MYVGIHILLKTLKLKKKNLSFFFKNLKKKSLRKTQKCVSQSMLIFTKTFP